MKPFSRGFLSIFGGKVGFTLLVIIITPILVRVLGPGGYGDYAFILSMYGIMAILYDIGLFDGARKFIAENKDDTSHVSEIASTSYIMGSIMVVLWTVLLLVFLETDPIRRILGEYIIPYFFLLIFALGCNQLFSISRSVLWGLDLEHKVEPLLPVRELLFGAIGIPLAHIGYGVTGALLGYAFALLIVGLTSFKMVFSRIKLHLFSGLKKHGEKLIKFGSYSMVLILLFQSLYQVDVIMVRYFLTSADTGYYKAALTTSEFTWFIPFALQLTLLHSASHVWANQGISKISNFTSKLVKYVVVLTFVILIGIFVLAEPFLGTYFGSEFTVARTTLWLLLPGVFGFSIARIIVPVIQGKGELKLLTKLMIVVASMNICLNFLLIPLYGMNGAAIATSISYGSMIFLSWYAARKVGFNPFLKVNWLRTAIAGLVTLATVYPLALIIPWTIPKLIVVPPIALIIYFSLVLKLRVLKIEEMREIIESLPSPLREKFNVFLEKAMPLLRFISG